MQKNKPTLILTPGDPNGIGAEIVSNAFKKKLLPKDCRYVVIGAEAPFQKLKTKYQIIENTVSPENLLNQIQSKPKGDFFLLSAPKKPPLKKVLLSGYQVGWSIDRAVHFCLNSEQTALVTGPIDKNNLIKGGFPFAGHTEFLAHLCGKKGKVTMMLANEVFRVSLVTTHIALKNVPKKLTTKKIDLTIENTVNALQSRFQIKKPKVAILGLNPHSGEGGLLGTEEKKVIYPAIKKARKRFKHSAAIEGPFPSDSFFGVEMGRPKSKRYDAIVAMYHDQGLIPVKLTDFNRSVNLTLGLPIVRTSVDHGTGVDIVGKGIADPSSLIAAVQQARKMVKKKI